MTNFLKELASIRYLNMSDETFLTNEIKEAVSFVSENFRNDLEKTRKGYKSRGNDAEAELRIDYVLPCLLYTSPSPRDATLSRMPSSA